MHTALHLLSMLTAVMVVLVALGVVSLVLAVRRTRRRTRHVLARARALRADPSSLLRTAPADPDWWRLQRHRRRLWVAVTRAERAVDAMRSSGAPAGDLVRLARELHEAADRADGGLRAGDVTRARGRVAELVAAAEDIRAAADSSLAEDDHWRVGALREAARQERDALRAGLRAGRAAGSR